MSLRTAAASPSPGMDLVRLDQFLALLQQRLSAPDYAAEHLLHAAIDPVHATRRHHEAAERQAAT